MSWLSTGRPADHLVRFLAGEFGVAPSAITVVYGRMDINKQLRIEAATKLRSVIGQLSLL